MNSNKKLQEELFDAIKANDLDAVKQCVEQGADVNAQNGDGWTPLHAAVFYEHSPEIICYLVEQGADINGQDKDGDTAIHMCHLQTGCMDYYYCKPSLEILGCLIRLGIDVNDINCDGYALLHEVVKNFDIETTRFLIEHGADINVKNHCASTPLHAAIQNNAMDLLAGFVDDSLMVNEYGVYGMDEDGLPSECLTIEKSHQDEPCSMIDYFIEQGADIYARGGWEGRTPLHMLAEPQHLPYTRVIRKLIALGADVNAKDENGETPLDIAKHPEVRKILLAAGAKSGVQC